GLSSNDVAGPANESSQSLTVTAVSATADTHGTVSMAAGTVTYTPAADYNGPASFDYTVCDNGTTAGAHDFKSDTGSVSVTVTKVNDPPVASDDIRGPVAEDGSLSFPAAGLSSNDVAGPANESSQSLTVTAVSATADTHGTVSLAAGTVTYTPAADYNGPASFDYTVRDNGTTAGADDFKSDTGSVSVRVTQVNDPPAASDDIRGPVAEDGSLGFPAAGFSRTALARPANESPQSLPRTAVPPTPHTLATLRSSALTVTYTPAADYNGPASFDYTVRDNGTTAGADDFKSDTGSVSVTVTEVNDPPVASDDIRGPVAEDGSLSFPAAGLSSNDVAGPANESSQSLTVTAVSATADTHGTVSLAAGTVTYTPAADYNGPA